jgi:hypothetical protein
MGYNTTAAGTYSTALGNTTQALGINSTAMGIGTFAKAHTSLTVGSYNDLNDAINDQSATSRLFQIGNGSGDKARSNALTILKNGNTGITTINPSAKLTIKSDNGNASWDSYIRLEDVFEGSAAIRFNKDRGLQFGIFNGNDGFSFVNHLGSEVVSITASGYTVIKDCLKATNVVCPSDIRLKENIHPLGNILNKINDIQPITYYFKDKNTYPASHQIGFNAQEMEIEFPELVQKDDKGFLAVNYAQMSAVAIQAIKEQQEIIKKQEEKISNLEKLNAEQQQINIGLENRMKQLEKLMDPK